MGNIKSDLLHDIEEIQKKTLKGDILSVEDIKKILLHSLMEEESDGHI